ncbi:hypothetical protein ABPG77_000901 [Micractinium sp. CCAP 211/92]
MAVGDHVQVHCGLYWHHGIDVGNDRVVSISPEGVLVQSLAEFSGGRLVVKVVYKPGKVRFMPSRIAERAWLSVNGLGPVPRQPYNLLSWNCEHFCIFCCTGIRLSQQVAGAGRTALRLGLLATIFPPATVAGLVVAGTGGLMLGVARTRELIVGTTVYNP